MKLRTKKTLAREFLILTVVFASGVVCFLCTYPYNYLRNNQVDKISKTVAEKTRHADTLSQSYKSKTQNQDWFFKQYSNKFDIENSKYNSKEIVWNRLYDLAKKDSLKLKWGKWEKETIENFKEMGFPSPESLKELIDTNIISSTDLNNYNQSVRITQELKALNKQKNKIEAKILSFKRQIEFGIKAAIFFAIILLGLRYLYYAIRWSIKTLKKKSE